MIPFNKIILNSILLLFTSSIFAQTEQAVIHNAPWDVMLTRNLTHFTDEHGSMDESSMTVYSYKNAIISLENDMKAAFASFGKKEKAIIAFDTKMNLAWKTEFSGYPMSIGMFKNKLLAITADGFVNYKGTTNSFTAWLIDPTTGRLISKKKIYEGGEEFRQEPVFLYAPNGSYFKMAVRTTSLNKKVDIMTYKKALKTFYVTEEFNVYSLSEDLALGTPIKPALADGLFGGVLCNNEGDLFIRTLKDLTTIVVSKYKDGQLEPVRQLQQVTGAKDLVHSYFELSKYNPQVIYLPTSYKNQQKDKALQITSLNFETGGIQNNRENFDKPHVKELIKSNATINKKLGKAKLNKSDYLVISNILETSQGLVVALSPKYMIFGNKATTYFTDDYLINLYDQGLSLKSQCIIPHDYSLFYNNGFDISLHSEGNTLYLAANQNKGATKFRTLFGKMDLSTGKMMSLAYLKKKPIKAKYPLDPATIFWGKEGFTLNYMEPRGFLKVNKTDVHLHSFNYL